MRSDTITAAIYVADNAKTYDKSTKQDTVRIPIIKTDDEGNVIAALNTIKIVFNYDIVKNYDISLGNSGS